MAAVPGGEFDGRLLEIVDVTGPFAPTETDHYVPSDLETRIGQPPPGADLVGTPEDGSGRNAGGR